MNKIDRFFNGVLRVNAVLLSLLGMYFGTLEADYHRGSYLFALAIFSFLMAREP